MPANSRTAWFVDQVYFMYMLTSYVDEWTERDYRRISRRRLASMKYYMSSWRLNELFVFCYSGGYTEKTCWLVWITKVTTTKVINAVLAGMRVSGEIWRILAWPKKLITRRVRWTGKIRPLLLSRQWNERKIEYWCLTTRLCQRFVMVKPITEKNSRE